MLLTSDVVHADADRASAARKLPQTAANFFVGTNSRVPRLTLAQSSHVIPLPAVPSPGLKPSSHLAHNRFRAPPVPSPPSSTKSANSPREPMKGGGKVAKAIHLFTNLTDEAASTTEEQLEILPTPTRQDDEASESVFSEKLSPSATTDAFAPSTTTSPSEIAPPPPPKTTEPQSNKHQSPTKTLSIEFPTSTSLKPSEQELQRPCSSILLNPAASADGQIDSSSVKEERNINPSPSSEARGYVDSYAFTLSSTDASSHDAFVVHIDSSKSSALKPNPNPPHSRSSGLSSPGSRSAPHAALPASSAEEQFSPHTFPRHANHAAGESLGTVFEVPQTTFESSLSQPSFDHTIFSAESPSHPASFAKSMQQDHRGLFSIHPVDTSIVAPKSAFSDATAPPSACPIGGDDLSPSKSASNQSHNHVESRLLQSWNGSNPSSPPRVAPPQARDASDLLPPLISSSSRSLSSPQRSEPENRSIDLGSPTGSHFSDNQRIASDSANQEPPLYEHVGVDDQHLQTNNSKPGGNVDDQSKRQQEELHSEDAPRLPGNQGWPLLPTESREQHIPPSSGNHQESEYPSGASSLGFSAKSYETGKPLEEDRLTSHSEHDRLQSEPCQQSERPNSPHDPQSDVDDDLLLDLIDVATLPAEYTEDDNRQKSLFERTASWIKATMDEHEPLPAEPSSFHQGNHDERSEATVAQPKTGTDSAHANANVSISPARQSGVSEQDKASLRLLRQADDIAIRKQASGQGLPPSNVNVNEAKRSLESRLNQLEAVHHVQRQPISRTIVRSYSQRDRDGQQTVKGTKRIPGRLKLPQHQPESLAAPRPRGSLELLSVRTTQDSSSTKKAAASQLEASSPYQGIDTERPSNFNDALHSTCPVGDLEASDAVSPRPGGSRVDQMLKDWDTSSEDDEVASVAVCKRMTLRRTSDFTIHGTPHRDTRTLPAKLQPAPADVVTPVESRSLPGKLPKKLIHPTSLHNARRLPGKLQRAEVSVMLQGDLGPTPGKLQQTAVSTIAARGTHSLPGKLQRAPVDAIVSRETPAMPGKLQRADAGTVPAQNLRSVPGRLQIPEFDAVSPQDLHNGRPVPGNLRRTEVDMAPSGLPHPLPGKLRGVDVNMVSPNHPHQLPGRLQMAEIETSPSRQPHPLPGKLQRIETDAAPSPEARPFPGRLSRARLDAVTSQDFQVQRRPVSEIGAGQAVLPLDTSTRIGYADEPQEFLAFEADIDPRQGATASSNRMQTPSSTPAGEQPSSIRPLKLQGSGSTFTTPRRPDVSVINTSPLTVDSELWTPDTSNQPKSTLTDETSVTTRAGLRPLLTAKSCSTQSTTALSADYEAKRTRPRVSTESSSCSQSRLYGQSRRHAFDAATGMSQPFSSQMPAPRWYLGAQLQQTDPRSNTDRPHSQRYSQQHNDPQSAATGANFGSRIPGFEISFELQEPRMAPHLGEGTLMEFGIRVLIKPSDDVQAADSWRLRPPSQLNLQSATPERAGASVHPMQYEYNHLSSDEMCRIQHEAQEHLTRTLASTDQRSRRLQLQESSLLSPFSDPRELDTSLTDTGSFTSSRQLQGRELKTHRQSGSPSTAPSSIHSLRGAAREAMPSASLASPIPYIKRAPPRTATVSSVIS